MSSRKRNHTMEELIELYQSKPCLWYVKGKDYHYRAKRDAAYKKLVNRLKKTEPDSVKDTVVKKINNLRCNVRNEMKIYEEIRGMARRIVQAYSLVLRFINFLGDQDIPNTSISNMDDEESEEICDDVSK